MLANTYAIVDEVEAARDPESGDPRFIARTDAPNAQAALGALLTVIAQTSGHAVLAEEGSCSAARYRARRAASEWFLTATSCSRSAIVVGSPTGDRP